MGGMIFFQRFYLDREKDIVVELFLEGDRMHYLIRTPNHHTGNLICNLARLCGLETAEDGQGLKVIRDEIPCYFDGDNRKMYILRLGNTKIANIYPDGKVELKASIPAISKTLMSQTKDYRLGVEKTIVKTYIRSDCKFRTDLHTHMNGNLPPDALIALGIVHQIRYPYYYVKKLNLRCTLDQTAQLEADRAETESRLKDVPLTDRHRDRQIDDRTYINFADLILGNPGDAPGNIEKIRNSLTIPKDGQAVFADLEKVYLYRYVFTKAAPDARPFSGVNTEGIPDREVRAYAEQMLRDREDPRYRQNTLYQDLLLWIAREYRRHGIVYAEISDTALVKMDVFPDQLRQIHEIMPAVTRETGVTLRFLAGIRRIPLTLGRSRVTPNDYLDENLRCLRVIAGDPYVAGSDIVGEEINDILELRSVIRELTAIAGEHPGFVIRIHAGENDSLRGNVANSIRCVADALRPGQPTPALRIGHGLYTSDLGGAKGKKLLEDMRRMNVTLEFQITSNVRLNNLSRLERHPLRQYLHAGIRCVQGTDGGALYGTNSIDEELSLEKLLNLSHQELCAMRRAEDALLADSMHVFAERAGQFHARCPGGDIARFYAQALREGAHTPRDLWRQPGGKVSAEEGLAGRFSPLPEGMLPVVVAGGSFNSSGRRTQVQPRDRELIDSLLSVSDPRRVFFVVGHTLAGQEGYLAQQAAGRFSVFAVVPGRLTRQELARLRDSQVRAVLSDESSGMGLYKCFANEIFNRMPALLLVFDGNSAAMNLIQEARNAQGKCQICLSSRSRGLAAKARMLEGYTRPLQDASQILEQMAGKAAHPRSQGP